MTDSFPYPKGMAYGVVHFSIDTGKQLEGIQETHVDIVDQIIHAGDKTDLAGFFDRPIRYMGRYGNELIFELGQKISLFGSKTFYEVIHWITPRRILIVFDGKGRDYNYINWRWK